MLLRRSIIVLALPLAVLYGCGNSRTPPPDVSVPLLPASFRTLTYPSAGISFRAPDDWSAVTEQAPLVTVVSSGQAVVAVWRFRRPGPLPGDPPSLRRALSALIKAAKAHNSTLRLINSRILSLNGAQAVEIDAFEQIGSGLRRVRSTHVYAYGSEVVLEEFAPPLNFHAVDHAVFSPVKRSLQVTRT